MNTPVIATTPTLLLPTSTASRRNSRRPNARPTMPENARSANNHQSPNATIAEVNADGCAGAADDMNAVVPRRRKEGQAKRRPRPQSRGAYPGSSPTGTPLFQRTQTARPASHARPVNRRAARSATVSSGSAAAPGASGSGSKYSRARRSSSS